ncbi:MAG: hypothetical protein AAFZ15_33175 [Bacteroidota bacterium]
MKNPMLLLAAIFITFFATETFAQPAPPACLSAEKQPYSDCTAIFLNQEMLVDDYSPKGKCKISQNATGTLFVSTTQLSLDFANPLKSIEFRVAIVNNQTNTIWQYSDKTYKKVDLEKILEKCEVGDDILIMTVDQTYSLPHNKIEIEWGC